MKIALISYVGHKPDRTLTGFNENDELLCYLQQKGLDIEITVWNDPAVNWADYKIALLKMPWDYHDKIEAFTHWLKTLERKGIRLFNDYTLIRWNMNKHYLQEIITAGLPVIPSLFLKKGAHTALAGFFEELHTDAVVVKPCISAGAKNTIIIKKENVAEDDQIPKTFKRS